MQSVTECPCRICAAITQSWYKYIGHASVETTALYDRREERARREVADHVYLPYIPWKGETQHGGDR